MEALGNIAPVIGLGSGLIGKILTGVQTAGQLNKVKAIENSSPQQLAGQVRSATQPLSQGLTEEVSNIVQANMAERGLAQAPGIFATTESQALAPFYQQNQNTALAILAQKWGIPLQALQALLGQPSSDLSPLMMMMMLRRQQQPQVPSLAGPPGGQTGDITGGPATPPTFGDSGGGGGGDFGVGAGF